MEPVEYQVVERRVFGLAPPALVGVVAAILGLAGVVLLVVGPAVAGIMLVLAAFLLAALYVEQVRKPADRLRWASGLAGGSAAAWASAGLEVARLRIEATRLTKQRARVLYELEHGDESARGTLDELDDQMRELVARLEDAFRRTRRRVEDERSAAARTVVLPPEE